MARDILLTGGTGQVGREILRLDWPDDVRLVAPARSELDLADLAATRAFVGGRDWAAIINCAAFTAVDAAESQIEAAWQLNAMLPALLAAATGPRQIPLLQISTDYVFDGAKAAPYEPADPTGPLSVYGASKLAGELAVRSGNPRHIVLRTSWVFGLLGANFVSTMLRLGTERPLLRVVDDQCARPTSAADLARVVRDLALRLGADRDAPTGTFHFANEGATSRYDFACEIFRQAATQGRPVPSVEPISTAAYPTPARRPPAAILSTGTLSQAFAVTPRHWREALADCMRDLF